jgi:two-component system cell cycle response regulator
MAKKPARKHSGSARRRQTLGEDGETMTQGVLHEGMHSDGDASLCAVLLESTHGLVPSALHLLEKRSGLRGLSYHPAEAQTSSGTKPGKSKSISVPLYHAGRTFGVLKAKSPATVGQLRTWASWLASWLALDARMHELADEALRDELTGVWNRRYFNRHLASLLQVGARQNTDVSLCIFDIDDFKLFNDQFGHLAGDEILRQMSQLLGVVLDPSDVVARLGGDEFAIIFIGDPRASGTRAKRQAAILKRIHAFQRAIKQHRVTQIPTPAPVEMSISGGLATFPYDANSPSELLRIADERAMISKRGLKNQIVTTDEE